MQSVPSLMASDPLSSPLPLCSLKLLASPDEAFLCRPCAYPLSGIEILQKSVIGFSHISQFVNLSRHAEQVNRCPHPRSISRGLWEHTRQSVFPDTPCDFSARAISSTISSSRPSCKQPSIMACLHPFDIKITGPSSGLPHCRRMGADTASASTVGALVTLRSLGYFHSQALARGCSLGLFFACCQYQSH